MALHRLLTFSLGTLFVFSAYPACSAQGTESGVPESKHVTVLLVNAAMGSASAGIASLLNGRPVRHAVFRGAIAGSIVFGGKWVVSQNSQATNLLGRSIAAAGSSGILDAAAGRGLFTVMIFSYGPIHMHVDRRDRHPVRAKIDVASSVVMIRQFRKGTQRFDLTRSAWSGVPIFKVDSSLKAGVIGGTQMAGVVTYRTATPTEYVIPSEGRKIIGHELVHVVQSDMLFNAFGAVLGRKVIRFVPFGRKLDGYLDLGIHVPIWSGVNAVVPYRKRPWEREAGTLAGR